MNFIVVKMAGDVTASCLERRQQKKNKSSFNCKSNQSFFGINQHFMCQMMSWKTTIQISLSFWSNQSKWIKFHGDSHGNPSHILTIWQRCSRPIWLLVIMDARCRHTSPAWCKNANVKLERVELASIMMWSRYESLFSELPSFRVRWWLMIMSSSQLKWRNNPKIGTNSPDHVVAHFPDSRRTSHQGRQSARQLGM